MNPASSDQALDSWIRQFYAAQTKPADPGRSRSATEMEVINIVNTGANKTSRCMIAAPALNTSAMGACDLAAGSKSELEMHRVAVSLINNVQAATSVTTTAVPRSSCNMIISNASASENISALHIFSSAFHNGQRAVAAAAEGGGLCRGAGAVKVKKKRVRPSRRVPTTMVKTDISNFKAMVEQFTGIPPTFTNTQESTAAPSASFANSRQSTSSVSSSPSFSKPLPHPVLSKFSNSSSAAPASFTAHQKEHKTPLVDAAFSPKPWN